jgi:DNA-binding NarL/FixJ family response regulator
MEHARIAVFEDRPGFRQLIKDTLSGTEHIVVAEADTLPLALKVISQMIMEELECDVITLDGNLSENGSFLADALEIIEAIQAAKLPVRVIGLAGVKLREWNTRVDVDLDKSAISRLPKVVDQL